MIGITTKETHHGNPGDIRILHAGLLVNLTCADNLPDDSELKFWASPLDGHPWDCNTAAWARDVGVGLREDDVVKQYDSLSDAFPEGDLQVWYMKSESFRDGISGAKPASFDMSASHVLLGSVRPFDGGVYCPASLDALWVQLQGEQWSPNGEANYLIRSKGLQHTSMSVGDCFRFANCEVWIVASTGFELVK